MDSNENTLEALQSCLEEVEDLKGILHANDYVWNKYSQEVNERVRLRDALRAIALWDEAGSVKEVAAYAREILAQM